MEFDPGFAKRLRRPVPPDFATLVAVVVARQSASATAQAIAAAGSRPEAEPAPSAPPAVLGPLVSGCFNSDVAALITGGKPT